MKAVLSPLSWVYTAGMNLREKLYRWGVFKSERLNRPVISVGNLTLGGTGKTVLVGIVTEQIQRRGLKPAILSRGFGRKTKGALRVDPKGRPEDFGDEPLMLARKYPDAIVIVSRNRALGARLAPEADVFILDDGFQNKDVVKDVDVVLMDATRPDEHYKVVPRGRAREPLANVARADTVVVTKTNLAERERVEGIKKKLEKTGCIDVSDGEILLTGITNLVSGESIEIRKNENVIAVSAIGNPESFEATLVKNLPPGSQMKNHLKFRDHYSYTPKDVEVILAMAKKLQCRMILTTEKDAVKLSSLVKTAEIPFGVVHTQYQFQPELPDFYDLACYNRN